MSHDCAPLQIGLDQLLHIGEQGLAHPRNQLIDSLSPRQQNDEAIRDATTRLCQADG